MNCFKKISASLGFFILLNVCSTYAMKPNTNKDSSNQISKTKQEKIINNVPYINQKDEKIPSGCEAVSATMLMNYYGYELKAKDFIDKYFIKKD